MKVYSVLRKLVRNNFPGEVFLSGTFLVFALMGPVSLQAQSRDGAQSPSLSELRKSYEKARLDATVPFSAELKKLKESYEAALGRLQGEFQAEGDLEAALEVRREMEAFQKSGHSGTGEVESFELVKLRKIFSRSNQSIVARQGAAEQKLAVAYQSALEALIPELTKAGQLDDAVKAKAIATALTVESGKLESKSQPQDQLSPEKEIKQLILSRSWTWTGVSKKAELVFKRDGTVFWGTIKCSWEIITGNDEARLVLYFYGNKGDPNRIEFSEDRKKLTIVNRSGGRFTFE
ncbi:MAG: hypothetical protein P1U86_02290 [Verrucomicrobiales bacterium]|nr:hypothetical protein [Verrucomicrobiales bacterium]